MKNRQVILLAGILMAIFLLTFLYKLLILKLPLHVDTQVNTWDVEVSISFQAHKEKVKVELYLPQTERQFELYDERFLSGDYGLAVRKLVNNRKAVWSVRQANGQQFLLYRASFRPQAIAQTLSAKNTPKITPPSYTGTNLIAANNLLSTIRKQSADVETMVTLLLGKMVGPGLDDNLQLLLGHDDSNLNRAKLAIEVLAMADIPARVVHGIQLQQMARQAQMVHWLEVYDKDRWRSFNVRDGGQELPDNYLPWWRTSKPLYKLEGGDNVHVRIASNLNPESALHYRSGTLSEKLANDFSLLNLPLETQAVYHVLLLVPVGVFLLVVLRNVVGVKTFGTFMPVLIAMSFRETQLTAGIVLFVLLVSLGLAVRFYLDRLKLLLVPRLAAVLIVVILLMVFISILSYKLGFPRGLSIALFPMVIMTMTIERMSIVWEERGATEAIEQGIGSLIVATLAYMVMNIQGLDHFVFVFPETLLLLLALTMLLGRYSGYRLSELMRFRELIGRS